MGSAKIPLAFSILTERSLLVWKRGEPTTDADRGRLELSPGVRFFERALQITGAAAALVAIAFGSNKARVHAGAVPALACAGLSLPIRISSTHHS
jgi:hypothetical protein